MSPGPSQKTFNALSQSPPRKQAVTEIQRPQYRAILHCIIDGFWGPRTRPKFESRRRPGWLLRIAASNRDLAGIPFQLGPADTKANSWMVLSQEARPWCLSSVEIPP